VYLLCNAKSGQTKNSSGKQSSPILLRLLLRPSSGESCAGISKVDGRSGRLFRELPGRRSLLSLLDEAVGVARGANGLTEALLAVVDLGDSSVGTS
jgi:hypothetical protein